MGYTIYIERRYNIPKEVLKKANDVWESAYRRAIKEVKNKGLSTEVYEWSGFRPLENKDFQFIKTARTPYDYAVKKAYLEMQSEMGNIYKVSCDDGFTYDSDGINLTGEGLMENYKPINPITGLKLSDLPIKYTTKDGRELELGEYSWNQGKKPKDFTIKKEAENMRKMQLRNDEYIDIHGNVRRPHSQKHMRDIQRDSKIKALHPGRRISANGNVYHENRMNRADIDRRKRL